MTGNLPECKITKLFDKLKRSNRPYLTEGDKEMIMDGMIDLSDGDYYHDECKCETCEDKREWA